MCLLPLHFAIAFSSKVPRVHEHGTAFFPHVKGSVPDPKRIILDPDPQHEI